MIRLIIRFIRHSATRLYRFNILTIEYISPLLCPSLKLKLEWNEIVTCVIWKYFITRLALRGRTKPRWRDPAEVILRGALLCYARCVARFCHQHIIWQRYNRAMHGALRDSLIEIWMNRVSKSDGNNSIGNRRSMLDRAKADRRSTRCGTPCFVSKHTGSRSLQNWIAPLFEDEKMRNNMPLSSQILSSRKDRIRFVKREIFFLSFRTIVDEIQRLVHSIRRYSKNVGKKCERQWPSLFILLLFISLMALR